MEEDKSLFEVHKQEADWGGKEGGGVRKEKSVYVNGKSKFIYS
jgi:hypothetical protein